MPGTVAITFLDAAGRDSAVSAGTPLPVTAGGATPAGTVPPANEAPLPIGGVATAAGTAPASTTAGQILRAWWDQRGALGTFLTDGSGTRLALSSGPVDTLGMIAAVPTYGYNWVAGDSTATARNITRGDVNGILIQSGALAASRWNYTPIPSGIVSSAAEFTIIAAGGAGVRNYLSSFTIDHDLLSAGVEFVIRDGSGGAGLYRAKLQTPGAEGTRYVPASPLRGTANTAMIGQLLTAVTGGVYVNASGYVGV